METAYANARPISRYKPARYHPGALSLADISRASSLRRVRQELHQCIDLRGTQRTLVIGGHDALPEALGHLGVGVDDRLLDERRVLALEDLVEVGAGRAVGVRLGKRVADAARGRARAVLARREDLLRVGRRAALTAAASASATALGGGPPHKGGEVRAGHHVGGLA